MINKVVMLTVSVRLVDRKEKSHDGSVIVIKVTRLNSILGMAVRSAIIESPDGGVAEAKEPVAVDDAATPSAIVAADPTEDSMLDINAMNSNN